MTLKRILTVVSVGLFAIWLANSSIWVRGGSAESTKLIAHRGVQQIYVGTDRSTEGCHAAPVEPVTHPFIANTIGSMEEAFRLGADVVELDVHRTTDNAFAVFHDWTVDCRTDGAGVTHEQALVDLKALDLGYRIDDGSGTFPLRGTAVGQMPSLDEVFRAELDGQFLINFKSKRRGDGERLAEILQDTAWRAQVYGVYGGAPPTELAVAAVEDLRGFSKGSITACLLRYIGLGWTGYVPAGCRNSMVLVPQNYAWALWGWPHRFTRRMSAVGTDVILIGPYDGSGFTSGVDSADAFEKVPHGFDGYVWTNRIQLIGPLNDARRAAP
ncbi:hypothetical protein KUV51_14595 [Tateyamaria omphalii]|uniref:glycerophosphodiester phosphodiesterase family protein n=1 Tax=Tateyamaria omphalii TaxID=299262 RepID=UPI001C99E439|nr:glycerophosphodiester phosphodiesterase family protein [Tateyamaria omphalii]MBY5934235.1 hypothetical protein [Tateyamaria omphalii]